jgi:hypothetical protein
MKWLREHQELGIIITFAILVVTYLGFAPANHWPPFSSSPSPIPTVTAPTTVQPTTPLRTVRYLDDISPSSGGPIGRGVAHINGVSFNNSIWLPFAYSCCGSDQSVTFSIPAGYEQFRGVLGQESAGFTNNNAYVMLFSISVNGITYINSQQLLYTDPSLPFEIPLSDTQSSIVIDVKTNCLAFYCLGNAVVGEARFLPKH